MKSSDLDKDLGLDICGLELFALDDHVEVCGKPGAFWGLVDKSGWENTQIVACLEHVNVLIDDPDVHVTSDVPFTALDEGECTC